MYTFFTKNCFVKCSKISNTFSLSVLKMLAGDKKIQYSTYLAGRVTYNFHSSCKHIHLSFRSVYIKEHKAVIYNVTSSSPVGRVLLEELLVLSRFHSYLRADKWNFCPLVG